MGMVWDRMEDEPARWYDRFEVYRMLGPGRSIEAAYRMATGSDRRPGSLWHQRSKEFNWRARSESWDADGWRQQASEEEDRRKLAREWRLRMLADVREWAYLSLKRAKLLDMDMGETRERLSVLRMMLSDAIRLERAEFGEVDPGGDNEAPGEFEDLVAEVYGKDYRDRGE